MTDGIELNEQHKSALFRIRSEPGTPMDYFLEPIILWLERFKLVFRDRGRVYLTVKGRFFANEHSL